MEIVYKDKTYIWDETKEWYEQEEEVQEVARQLIGQITNTECVHEEREQAGYYTRATLQVYHWNGIEVEVIPQYTYPPEHPENGKITITHYKLKRYELE